MNRVVPSHVDHSEHQHTVPMTKPNPQLSPKISCHGLDLTDLQVQAFKQTNTDTRTCKCALSTHRLISTTSYRIASMVAVIVALFLQDVSRCAFPASLDYGVEICMLAVFFFLLTDVILQSVVYPRYVCSMFFWLDFVGTLTLLADIGVFLSLLGYSYSDLTVARGGRAGRAARTAGSLRISRIVMWARVARLMRLGRLMRFLKDGNSQSLKRQNTKIMQRLLLRSGTEHIDDDELESFDHEHDDREHNDSLRNSDPEHPSLCNSAAPPRSRPSDASSQSRRQRMSKVIDAQVYRQRHSSKIGLKVSDGITRDVVFGILLTVALTPIFNSAIEETYSAMFLAADWFDVVGADAPSAQHIALFLDNNPDVLAFDIDGVAYADGADRMALLRETETLTFSGDHTHIVLDISEDTRFGHGMNIGFTLVIVLLFAGLAFLITSSIQKLVIVPIERMTRIIQEFTKRIVFLGGDMADQRTIVSNLLETQVIEAAIGTLGNIFNSISIGATRDNDGSLNVSQLNVRQLRESMSSSASPVVDKRDLRIHPSLLQQAKPPQKRGSFNNNLAKREGVSFIKTRDSVITFKMSEKKRVFISEEEIQHKIRDMEREQKVESFCVSVEKFPELGDVSSAMTHPIASEYFRSFCYAHSALENYNFVRAVQRFHEVMRKEFQVINQTYIDDDAEEQICVDAKKRRQLLALYDANKFSVDSFDLFRRDIVFSLQRQVFANFLDSKWSSAYVASMDEIKNKYKHLDLDSTGNSAKASPRHSIVTICED